MGQIGKFRTVSHEGKHGLMFWCPGCDHTHVVTVNGKDTWTFNGDYDKATISPSVLTHGTEPLTDEQCDRILAGEKFEPKKVVCHLFLRDGMLQFLGDCTHKLSNQTVPLPELPDWAKD